MTQGLHSLNGRLAAANNVCRRPWEPLPLRWQRRRSFQLSRSFRGVGTETSEDSLLSSSKKANKPAAFYPPPPCKWTPAATVHFGFWPSSRAGSKKFICQSSRKIVFAWRSGLCSLHLGGWLSSLRGAAGGAAEGWRLFGESAVVVVGRGTEPGAGIFFFGKQLQPTPGCTLHHNYISVSS